MSEIPTYSIDQIDDGKAFEAYTKSSEQLKSIVPELESNPEIAEAGKKLIEQFGVNETLFTDMGRTLIFNAIAARQASLGKLEAPQEDNGEEEFIADTMTLLAHEHSTVLQDASAEVKSQTGEIDQEARKRVYDRYTDAHLSAKVTEIIKGGFLDSVKQQLGVSAENEDKFTLRVLSISDEYSTSGIDAPRPNYELGYNSQELDDQLELQSDVKAWKKGLVERGEVMSRELGHDGGMFAPAWVADDVDGGRTLCISMPLAEKICDPTVTENTDWYDAGALDRSLAILAHEYTHTQGGVSVNGETFFAINVEELRAEHFSGNKNGYQEVKAFFSSYATVTGQSIPELMNGMTKGGSTVEVLGAIANRVGLQRMLEVSLACPNNYADSKQSVSFLRAANSYLGSFDGVIGRLYDDQVSNGEEDQVWARIDLVAGRMADVVRGNDDPTASLEFYASHQERLGNSFMISKTVAAAQRLLQQKSTS